MFYGAKNVYALYAVLRPRIDTVGVWGSNPHAPTNLSATSPILCVTFREFAFKIICHDFATLHASLTQFE